MRVRMWLCGGVGSLLAHGALFLALDVSVAPEPVPSQPKPDTQLTLDSYAVEQHAAIARATEGATAQHEQPAGASVTASALRRDRVGAGDISTAFAKTVNPDGNTVAPGAVTGARISASDRAGQRLTNVVAPPTDRINQKALPEPVSLANISVKSVEAIAAPSQSLTAKVTRVTAQATTVGAIPKAGDRVAVTHPRGGTIAEAVPQSSDLLNAQPDAAQVAPIATDGTTADAVQPVGVAAQTAPLSSQGVVARLAWNFGDRVVTDPKALETIQAFMEPADLASSDTDAGQVKDDLSAVLGGFDCARLSATFLPETGTLELRGHVPENALRAPILAALQARVGEGLRVTDNLLHLPKPQCGALSGIASVGLPQSTDQITNARLIGQDAQAREYAYSEGQPLSFDMVAPDYDAFVYVDYFDAAGQVIHLVPNRIVALERYEAASVVGIEKDPSKPRLNITIGPPFGQEIAVAFAASEPLYEGARPLIEPAEAYLEFLKERVAAIRQSATDFKGEWVYFFITTRPATQ